MPFCLTVVLLFSGKPHNLRPRGVDAGDNAGDRDNICVNGGTRHSVLDPPNKNTDFRVEERARSYLAPSPSNCCVF